MFAKRIFAHKSLDMSDFFFQCLYSQPMTKLPIVLRRFNWPRAWTNPGYKHTGALGIAFYLSSLYEKWREAYVYKKGNRLCTCFAASILRLQPFSKERSLAWGTTSLGKTLIEQKSPQDNTLNSVMGKRKPHHIGNRHPRSVETLFFTLSLQTI